MGKKRMLITRENAAVKLALKEVDALNKAGLLECLEAGLPTLVERYGHHSYEVRSAEQMMAVLSKG
jgi:hypothetical protein